MIAGAGLKPVSAGMSNVEMREQRSRRWPETDAQPVRVWATRMWAQVMAPSTLEDLLVCMEGWPPDVVLHEEGEYAAPVAAAEAGIPWVTHGWGSPLRSASELAEIEDLASALWESCGRDVPAAAGLYAYALVNPCPPMLQDQPPPGASVVWPIRPRLLTPRHGVRFPARVLARPGQDRLRQHPRRRSCTLGHVSRRRQCSAIDGQRAGRFRSGLVTGRQEDRVLRQLLCAEEQRHPRDQRQREAHRTAHAVVRQQPRSELVARRTEDRVRSRQWAFHRYHVANADGSGRPTAITATPDVSEFDPYWSSR